ncbi:MAG: hypothetical protein LBE32_05520 [Burkholderiales bacterium]|jgi:hypothetical protein|nr:hypothetical protein [Burkholderiales bacterium]
MQQALFFDDVYKALDEVVKSLGGSKRVGPKLWPEKSPDAAARQLADCLNSARSEKLSPEQVILLLRLGGEAGCHTAMHFICGEAGYAPATPVTPEGEMAALQRQYIEAARAITQIAQRIEAAEART